MNAQMPGRVLTDLRMLLAGGIALTIAAAAAMPAAHAAATAKAPAVYKAPRTEFGQPDLQGTWTNATITPLERPDAYGSRLVLTAEEAGKLEQAEADFVEAGNQPTDPKKGILDLPVNCRPGFSGTNCGYNNFWVDAGTKVVTINGEMRTSILTTPNGKIPPLTPQAQKRRTERMAGSRGRGAADGPEVRSLGERCLMSFGSSAGPPMLPLLYNNNYQIVQTPDTVMILVEMVHDVRIIRMGGTHSAVDLKRWMGDSIGHWEGDTLVIETINLNPQQSFRGTSDNAKVIERLTRVAPNQIRYQFSIDDPATFSQAWGGELNMNASAEPLYEYACHEGNYALPGILAGAREEESVAAEKDKKKK
jgi:hypothetical protein